MSKYLKIDFHVIFPFLISLLLWIIFYYQEKYKLETILLGVAPREWSGIKGVFIHFFIHASFNHLLSNTLSFLVLSLLLFIGYREIAFKVFFILIFFTGMILWLIGRNFENGLRIYHVGASGVIFSLFGFLLTSGIARRNKPQMALTALVIFLYGYLIWGIFPIEKQISWDGHLSGLISGIMIALIFRRKGGQPKYQLFSEEEELALENLPESEKYWLNTKTDNEVIEIKTPVNHNPIILNFNYEFIDKKEKSEKNKE